MSDILTKDLTMSDNRTIIIPMQASKHIKDIVKEGAQRKGISLVKLSRMVGVSYSHLRAVLLGIYTSRPVIKRISEILELPELPEMYEQYLQKSHKEVEP